MVATMVSAILPSANAYAATSNTSNKESNLAENQSQIDKVNEDKKDNEKLKNDKAENKDKSKNEVKEDNLQKETDRVLDEEEKTLSPGWHVIKGKRFYFTKDGMLEKKGWYEIEEYILKGTESNPQVYEPTLKKKENVNSKESNSNNKKKEEIKDKKQDDDKIKNDDKNIEEKDNKISKDDVDLNKDLKKDNKKNIDMDSDGTSNIEDEYEVVDPSKDSRYVLHKNTYYFNDDYSVTTGWKDFTEKWYNFNEYGAMRTDWNYVDGKWYYFDSHGEMQTGWIELNKDKYYLYKTGEMASGKMNIDDKWYYFSGSGVLQSGFYKRNGKECYSNTDGEMISNKWIENGGEKYYIKANGELAIGNIIIDGKVESFTESGIYKGKGKVDENLYVEYLNAGNADCIFIKLPNGETALIDTGLNTKNSEDKLTDFLNKQDMKEDKDGIKTINYVIITHPHSDHIGGLYKILKTFNVEKIYMPKKSYLEDCSDLKTTGPEANDIKIMQEDYKIFKKTMDLIKDQNIEVINAVKGQEIDKDGILKFVNRDVYYAKPLDERVSANYWQINNQSAVVYLKYNDLGALFTGDIEWLAEKDIVESDLLSHLKIDVLKVPHHGIDTSSSYSFVNYVGADIGIIPRETNKLIKNDAYTNLITGRVTLFETGLKDGVSLYATKDGWNVQY